MLGFLVIAWRLYSSRLLFFCATETNTAGCKYNKREHISYYKSECVVPANFKGKLNDCKVCAKEKLIDGEEIATNNLVKIKKELTDNEISTSDLYNFYDSELSNYEGEGLTESDVDELCQVLKLTQ